MARGQFKLFIDQNTVDKHRPRRRRNYRLPDRNRALATRYHYHTHYRRKKYLDAILALEDEFFLSQDRIIDILTREAFPHVEDLADKQPSLKELAAKYPQWSWRRSN